MRLQGIKFGSFSVIAVTVREAYRVYNNMDMQMRLILMNSKYSLGDCRIDGACGIRGTDTFCAGVPVLYIFLCRKRIYVMIGIKRGLSPNPAHRHEGYIPSAKPKKDKYI